MNYLNHRKAPPVVQRWVTDPPSWAEVHQTSHALDNSMQKLDAGEEDAIALAVEPDGDLILMDDRDGVVIARSKGFRVAGTLGILSMAAANGILPRPSSVSSKRVFTTGEKSWNGCSPEHQELLQSCSSMRKTLRSTHRSCSHSASRRTPSSTNPSLFGTALLRTLPVAQRISIR